jgi:hypothetical protein
MPENTDSATMPRTPEPGMVASARANDLRIPEIYAGHP